MKITNLQLARCSDRKALARGPDMVEFARNILPRNWNLISFHFIVNWSTTAGSIGKTCLVTKLLKIGDKLQADKILVNDIRSTVEKSKLLVELREAKKVLTRYGKRTWGLVLPEIPVAQISEETAIWLVKERDDRRVDVTPWNVGKLMQFLREERDGCVSLGTKGLIYGTSAIECYLAKTGDIFPGDADAVLTDEEGKINKIIEFKKHTRSDRIGNHLASNYYPKPDGRKWKALRALWRNIVEFDGEDVDLIILYYSIKPPYEVRLQTVEEITDREIVIKKDSGTISGRLWTDKVKQQVREYLKNNRNSS